MSERAVLYARVSGDDRGNEGRNLKGQLDMCRKYALENNWQVIEELAEDDRGASGASFELPQLTIALDMAFAGAFDILVVREIDRLSRRLAKQLFVEEEFNRHGVEIEYVLGDYDDTAEGGLLKNVRAVIAEYERLKTIERTTRGKINKVKAGSVIVSGSPPFGYSTKQDERGHWLLLINEDEARIVSMIYDLYVDGESGQKPLSISAIARYLTDMRIPTPSVWQGRNMPQKKAEPHRWNGEVVRRILINETYAGTWHFGKNNRENGGHTLRDKSEWIPVEVPAIISREQWDRIQRRRKKNQHFSPRNTKHKYLLRRRIRCGRCGATMRAYCKADTEKYTYTYYMCSRRNRPMHYASSECDARLFRVDAVDATAWNWIRSLLENPEVLNRGLHTYIEKREQELAPLRERLDVISGLLESNNEKLERLADLYISGDIDREGMDSRKRGLIEEESILIAERQRIESRADSVAIGQENISSLKAFADQVAEGLAFAADDFEVRNQIFTHLNVSASLIRENNVPMLDIECVLGGKVLPIAAQTTNCSYQSRDRRQ